MAFVALAAIGIDLGRLAFTTNETQLVADAAALAGARALADGAPVAGMAHAVAAENTLDGDAAAPADVNVEVGAYDGSGFVPTDVSPNAVRATVGTVVDNIVAGAIGYPQSTVEREAIAAASTLSAGRPTLPLSISDCNFPPDCQDASCLPTLHQTPSTTDNSAWTGFFGNADNGTMTAYLPATCGSGTAVPEVRVGDHVSLNNGQLTNLLNAVECVVCRLDQREFLVPVIQHCNQNFTSASPPPSGNHGTVVGFASIAIDSFNTANGNVRNCDGGGPDGINGPAPVSVNLHAVRRVEPGPGNSPCTGCGTVTVRLTN